MRVTPITEYEASIAGLWPREICDFEVTEAAEEQSKSGNDMIKLNVTVYNKEGRSRKFFDYLVSTEGMAYKVRHFAATTGMLAAYEKGELRATDCIGKAGKCQVGIQPEKNGYPAKNIISDYVPPKPGEPLVGTTAPSGELDDEIPF